MLVVHWTCQKCGEEYSEVLDSETDPSIGCPNCRHLKIAQHSKGKIVFRENKNATE